MRQSHIWLAAWALAVACLGCGKAEVQGGGDKGASFRIAVIPKGTTHEFWKAVHAGASDAGKEFGVEIIWKGPLKEDDREQQIKVVEDFVSQRVDGIVLAPLDDTALRPAVDSANAAGIPVVIFDSDLKGGDIVSFVATDNVKGGELGGEHLAKLVRESGGASSGAKRRVALLRYQEGSASTANREQGFLNAMARHPEIEVVSQDQYGGATRESAYAASENILARFKNSDGSLGLDGIFCPNESTTFGMLRALQDSGFAGKVSFVGFDSSSKLVDALKAKQLHGLVLQNPYKMGYEAVRAMVARLKGGHVERRIDTGVALVTPENLAEESSQKLLFPPQR